METHKKKDTINLKEIFLSISEWVSYLFSKWKTILICGILGASIGLTYAWMQKKLFTAELTFAVEEKSSAMGAYSGIASQFGIDLSKGEGGLFAGDNLIELFKSRLIIENALLTSEAVEGKKDLLVNRYIRFNKLDVQLKSKKDFENLKFVMGQLRTTFSQQQDSLLFIICENIKKNSLRIDRSDKKLNIINVSFRSYDELFAKHFLQVLLKNVTEFYIDTKTNKLRSNIFLLENRVDSVKTALDNEMVSAAVNQDQNQNPVKAQGRVPYAKRQLNIQLLTTLYGELVRNLEFTKLTLMREEPLFQIIDRPILPLKYEKPGRLFSLIIGGVISGFIIVIILIAVKIYKNIMTVIPDNSGT